MTHIALSRPCSSNRSIGISGVLNLLSLARQRRALARLDDHMLEDIGITRDDALAEAARPVWDAPNNWFKQNQ